jgi:tyrosine-protein kinase
MPDQPGADQAPQFVEYLETLRRRKWTILVVTILAVGAALGFSKSRTPVYDASAKILIQSTPAQVILGGGSSSSSQTNIADEIQRLESPQVATIVRKQLGSAPPVSGSALSANTDVMVVKASSTSASEAARIANAYAAAYIQQRQAAIISSYSNTATSIQHQITVYQAQIAALPAEVNGAPNPQVTALATTVASLQEEANTLRTDAAVSTSAVQLLQPATVPTSPSSPKTVRNVLLGLAGGLVLGIALAFLRESLDDTIVTREDLDRRQPGLPVLGAIPSMSTRGSNSKELVAASRPHSFAAEAYRSLRTSIQFLALDQPVRLLQITSPRTAEGKTTTVANLAITLAAAGQRVIAVDCDLRRSRLHEVFGISNKVGFTSVLMGEVPMSGALQEIEGQQGLLVLASGQRPPNPAELLSSTRNKEVFASLGNLADIVLVDSPPVLPVTDASLISTQVDATLVVVSAGLTTAKDLARALETLGQVDAPVTGAVLNSVPVNAGYRYRYRYQYSYSPEPRHLRSGDRP